MRGKNISMFIPTDIVSTIAADAKYKDDEPPMPYTYSYILLSLSNLFPLSCILLLYLLRQCDCRSLYYRKMTTKDKKKKKGKALTLEITLTIDTVTLKNRVIRGGGIYDLKCCHRYHHHAHYHHP